MEIRVLGCLIEKEMTTPDYYPMTINALQTACNQKSNRLPVVDYTEAEVVQAVDGLREQGMARAMDLMGDSTSCFFAPLDLVGATRRALQMTRPDLLVLLETEIWPNLIIGARRMGIPDRGFPFSRAVYLHVRVEWIRALEPQPGRAGPALFLEHLAASLTSHFSGSKTSSRNPITT